ncbi:MAG: hypothetical protein K2X35_14310 [Bryobacteraceae bacterium]|nr:hypothetical protein [Bryobacteraceae bacterium]
MKTWFDSSVAGSDLDGGVSYQVIAADNRGFPGLRTIVMSAEEAATVNLPGPVNYEVRRVQATGATRGGAPVNPVYLSLESEARQLRDAVGTGVVVDEGATAMFGTVYPSDEPRRMWALVVEGIAQNVGVLLNERHGAGLNSPGAWKVEGGLVTWVPAPPPVTEPLDRKPAREVPVRALLANEVLEQGRFAPVVARTDKRQQTQQASGWFTAGDREMLRECRELLAKIASRG